MEHRRAYLKVEKELLGRNTIHGYLHDLNKIFLYILGLPTKMAHYIHYKLSPHHVKNNDVRNPIAAVIDWECAKYTKPDKALPAYDYYKKRFPNGIPKIESALKQLGLWKD